MAPSGRTYGLLVLVHCTFAFRSPGSSPPTSLLAGHVAPRAVPHASDLPPKGAAPDRLIASQPAWFSELPRVPASEDFAHGCDSHNHFGWRQNGDLVQLAYLLPSDTSTSEVSVQISRRYVHVRDHRVVRTNAMLAGPVCPDASFWELINLQHPSDGLVRCLVVELAKASGCTWEEPFVTEETCGDE